MQITGFTGLPNATVAAQFPVMRINEERWHRAERDLAVLDERN
ncbi:hypothetical protein [Streptomyces sp. NPDC005408]